LFVLQNIDINCCFFDLIKYKQRDIFSENSALSYISI
jgi:hypothetical protein